MDRKSFFKRLFGTVAVAVVAPRILAEKENGYDVPRKIYPVGIKDPIDQGNLIASYDMKPNKEGFLIDISGNGNHGYVTNG